MHSDGFGEENWLRRHIFHFFIFLDECPFTFNNNRLWIVLFLLIINTSKVKTREEVSITHEGGSWSLSIFILLTYITSTVGLALFYQNSTHKTHSALDRFRIRQSFPITHLFSLFYFFLCISARLSGQRFVWRANNIHVRVRATAVSSLSLSLSQWPTVYTWRSSIHTHVVGYLEKQQKLSAAGWGTKASAHH